MNYSKKINCKSLILIAILLVFLSTSHSGVAQLYFPNENFYHSEIERYNMLNNKDNNYQLHLAAKPILDTKTNKDSIYNSTGKYYYWITQKLFKENFIIFKGDDFWCSVDPILDAQLGTDLSLDSTYKMYWNTRGIRVQAKFFDKVAFTTSVYENQAIVPVYQANYFNKHGEFRPTNLGYKQENAFVPMYARTKPFKVNGYDFAFAEGTLSIVPNKNLNFQLGNGNLFIGEGYRSFFLSDFSGNYPFLKTEFFLFNGKLQYNVSYASLTNPYRLSLYSTPEATYERKIGVFQYLDYTVSKSFSISLFEGSNWRGTDSLGTHSPNYLFLNPIIGTNSIINKSNNNNGYNSVVGLAFTYKKENFKAYSQLLIDNGSFAGQFGFKIYNILIDKLDFRAEYNLAEENLYLSKEVRYNYSHNNLSLGHPLVAGFNELVFILSYQKDRWFVNNKLVFYGHRLNDYNNIGTVISQPISNFQYGYSYYQNVFNNRFEIGYRFNKNYNLQAVGGWLFRQSNVKSIVNQTNYVYFGLRTRLRNKKLDW